MSNEDRRVCVVGAGPAGIAAARALKAAGLGFDVFEKNPGVGGIWNPDHAGSPMYDSAHFISSKGMSTSTFRGHPFPGSAAVYPSHAEVLAYLEGVVAGEGLLPSIHLSMPVERAERVGDGWNVRAGGMTRNYAALICASGSLWDPVMPDIEGRDCFGGMIRHSVSYRSADEIRGKRVVVVGAGNSAVDIACDAARSAVSVSLSLRRGYWFVPKFIGGRPTDTVFRDQQGLADWVQPPNIEALLELLVGRPESFGLPRPDHAPFSSHPIMNTEVLHHLGHGRIKARTSIERVEPGVVVYDDGHREPADEIILATGYRASVPYLADDVLDFEGGNRPRFWMRLFHPTHRNLYGLGFIETNSSVYGLFESGAELIAAHIRAGLDGNPARDAFDAEIESGREPDLTGGRALIGSMRHVGYVDSRIYQRELSVLLNSHFTA
ncbi:MAG: NAD(P)/FAD-dependent oxidoreductase [bacterium]|nr:NAD(P)/FAD-dependent oxidoreductase [bacterium]